MSRRRRAGIALLVLGVAAVPLRTWLFNSLAFYPDIQVTRTPAALGMPFQELSMRAEDGVALHGWWIPPTSEPALGSVLYCHGNGGNVGSRLEKAKLLASRGLGVLLFDYRGYGKSEGSPTERGTYLDARAALAALLSLPRIDPTRLLYVGESLGGAVAIELAVEAPPRGLVLQSTFTSMRDMGSIFYPYIPRLLTPDAYPSIRRIATVRCPILIVHGDRDRTVPHSQGRALFEAAAEPKRFETIPGADHNDIVSVAGDRYGALLEEFARSLR